MVKARPTHVIYNDSEIDTVIRVFTAIHKIEGIDSTVNIDIYTNRYKEQYLRVMVKPELRSEKMFPIMINPTTYSKRAYKYISDMNIGFITKWNEIGVSARYNLSGFTKRLNELYADMDEEQIELMLRLK